MAYDDIATSEGALRARFGAHLFDYVPAGQHAGILGSTGEYDATPDLQRMLNELLSNPVDGHLPGGTVWASSLEIPGPIELVGIGNRRSRLRKIAGTSGELVKAVDVAANHFRIANVQLYGDITGSQHNLSIDRVIAPNQAINGVMVAALSGEPGNIDDGVHQYRVSFRYGSKESGRASAVQTVTVLNKTSNGQVALSSVPTSPASAVDGRYIYRTKAGGSEFYLLATIADNTTTTFTDNVADVDLGTRLAPPADNAGEFYDYDAYAVLENVDSKFAGGDGYYFNSGAREIKSQGCSATSNNGHGVEDRGSDSQHLAFTSSLNQKCGIYTKGGNSRWVSLNGFLNGEGDPTQWGGFLAAGQSTGRIKGLKVIAGFFQDNYGFGGYFGYCDGLMLDVEADHNSTLAPGGAADGSKLYDGVRLSNCRYVNGRIIATERFHDGSTGTRSQRFGASFEAVTDSAISLTTGPGVETPYSWTPTQTPSLTSPVNFDLKWNGRQVNQNGTSSPPPQNGTFTPILGSSAAAPGHTFTSIGRFDQSNRLVTIRAEITMSAKNAGAAAGDVRVTGFPFAAAPIAGLSNVLALEFDNVDLDVGYTGLSAIMPQNSGYVQFIQTGDNLPALTLKQANLTATSRFVLGGGIGISN